MTQFPPSAPFVHQQHIGQVGGVSNVWQSADASLTRPNNTTAYSANQAVGSSTSALFTFSGFFRAPGGSGLLTGLRLVASGSGIATTNMGAIRAHLFNASPTVASGLSDQGTFTTLVADDKLKLGVADFTSWTIGGTGSTLIESYGSLAFQPLPIIGAAGSLALFAVLEARGAFTPLAQSVTQIYASAALD